MPPKGKGKSKGPPNEVYYADQKVSDEIIILTLRLATLKKIYVDRMECLAAKRQNQCDLTSTLSTKETELAEKSKERMDILTDYTRQYKTDEREMITKLAALDSTVSILQEEKLRITKEMSDREMLYDKKIKEAKLRHDALCQRIADMEKEFAVMLDDIEQSIRKS